MYQDGPIRFVASDSDGRRFPCACHKEPTFWVINTVVRDWHKMVYTSIPISTNLNLFSHLIENALNTIEEYLSDHSNSTGTDRRAEG